MIDIIIPVYNTPIKDLNRCLNSILKQTYKKYKVYIIDDGSKASISHYLDTFVASKPNFCCKHIPNGGASNARNIGLKVSKSEYVTFVDSDDTITPNFLSEAIKILEDNNLDIVVGGYNEVADSYVYKIRKSKVGFHLYDDNHTIKYFNKLISSKLSKDNLELDSTPTGRIYTKLYKRSVFKDVYFNRNITISEDTLFLIDIMKNVDRIGVVPNIWYNYYNNYYSIVHKTPTDKDINNLIDFINEIYKRMLKCRNRRLKNAYRFRIFKASSDLYNKLIKSKLMDPKDIFSMNLFKTLGDLDFTDFVNVTKKEMDIYKKIISYMEFE